MKLFFRTRTSSASSAKNAAATAATTTTPPPTTTTSTTGTSQASPTLPQKSPDQSLKEEHISKTGTKFLNQGCS